MRHAGSFPAPKNNAGGGSREFASGSADSEVDEVHAAMSGTWPALLEWSGLDVKA
jgi:hypothetical protein